MQIYENSLPGSNYINNLPFKSVTILCLCGGVILIWLFSFNMSCVPLFVSANRSCIVILLKIEVNGDEYRPVGLSLGEGVQWWSGGVGQHHGGM